jgi:transposase
LEVKGIGTILALTIMLEAGDIKRFAAVGDSSYYCQCVSTQRLSNGKSKGKGNGKNGNRYLSWAYVEAANCMVRCCSHARAFYQRKRNSSGTKGEKSNDLAVEFRQKHNGMSWSKKGSTSLASITVLHLNKV